MSPRRPLVAVIRLGTRGDGVAGSDRHSCSSSHADRGAHWAVSAACPGSDTVTRRIRSRCERRLLNTAVGGLRGSHLPGGRRLRCFCPDCPNKTFAEQVSGADRPPRAPHSGDVGGVGGGYADAGRPGPTASTGGTNLAEAVERAVGRHRMHCLADMGISGKSAILRVTCGGTKSG